MREQAGNLSDDERRELAARVALTFATLFGDDDEKKDNDDDDERNK